VAPPILFNEPNDVADFHVPMPSPALPNGEVDRPRAGASSATRAQNSEARSRRAYTDASRSAPSEG